MTDDDRIAALQAELAVVRAHLMAIEQAVSALCAGLAEASPRGIKLAAGTLAGLSATLRLQKYEVAADITDHLAEDSFGAALLHSARKSAPRDPSAHGRDG